jgi:D-arginine dehydrogenase
MRTAWVIVGAGIAGAAAAWALARRRLGPGVVLEREPLPGMHASGRNAALAYQAEGEAPLRLLAARSVAHLRALDQGRQALLKPTGALTLAGRRTWFDLAARHQGCRRAGIPTTLLPRQRAVRRFPFLERVEFEAALWSPTDGVLDIHELLARFLTLAREDGFALHTRTTADDLYFEGGRLRGVMAGDRVIRADGVIDASGAWAGRLGRRGRPLPLQPFRRHLFVTGTLDFVEPAWPPVWSLEGEFYFRPESGGLLLSPCDETPWPAEDPPVDPAAADLLADKLARHAPTLVDAALRRRWACLRTFAPDRLPLVGPDPDIPGLYHLAGLGGIGMTVSAAVGELLAAIVAGERPDWIEAALLAPARLRHETPVAELPEPTRPTRPLGRGS